MPEKTILVTGCSAGGIGAAIASALATHHHHVFATARNISKIPESLSSLDNVTIFPLDVCDLASIREAVKFVTDSGRGLDVQVNNAGAAYGTPVLDIDIERAQKLYDLNVWGPIRMIQAFSKLLIASRGRVVNISTCGAVVYTTWMGVYSSSKAALTNLSKVLRLELAPFGVAVVTIMAGTINSHFHDNDDFHLPPTSLSIPIEKIITGWANGESKPKGMPAEKFAETLVDDIVGSGTTGLLWRGVNSNPIKSLGKFAPQFITASPHPHP
ncbi:oxidoreductase- short-chain dehydrogenase/reductase family [Apiospora phragmitis]|uniref:Oxidoreductase- short-chain dehydrogenase/reductase family n=1 Tax=Apiospora phragmitis TaxID=2905665 RepID=A0ABR1URR9_9PEZI